VSLLSVGSWLSTGSLLSAQSRWSIMSWRSALGVMAAGAAVTAVSRRGADATSTPTRTGRGRGWRR
jgi:hypothetical protein